MKKIILLAATVIAQLMSTNCEAIVQTVNMTTGPGAVGSTGPWMVKLPGGTTFIDAYASNATLLETATGTKRNSWATNACGKWISPHTILTAGANFGNIPDIPSSVGNYTYRLQFYNGGNCPLTASMSLIAGGDNNITSIKLNGSPAHAVSATYSPLANITLTNLASEIGSGFNVIDVTVNNAHGYTGMMLCGNLTIDYGNGIYPIFTGASSFCPGEALIFNGSASSSTGYIQSHFWEIAECDAAGNYTNPSAVWNSGFSGVPSSINFSTINLGFTPQCGKYYRVKLAVINPCVPWNELSKVIFIKCKPTVLIDAPEAVCEGSSIPLAVSGNASSYTWGAPFNQTANSVLVTVGAGTTIYTVTGTLNGCTASATVAVTGAPANLNINISTGVNNTTGALIASGFNDDTWHNRGVPGTIATTPYNSTPFMRVVNPYYDPIHAWVTSPNAKWITTANGVNSLYNPAELACSESSSRFGADDHYWFETKFNLPISSYSNLRMEVEYAVDNSIAIYLNSLALNGTFNSFNNLEYVSWTYPDSQFTTLHNIGTIATNQSHYTQGENTVLVEVWNGGGTNGPQSVMGLLLNARVKGECTPQYYGKEVTVTINEDMVNEHIAATTFLYPNPSQGSFSIENSDRIISGVTVRDALGRVVKTMTDLNTNSVQVELSGANKGFYFAEITYKGQMKPVFKKIIIE